MPAKLAIRAIENTQDPGDPMCTQIGNIVSVGPANWDCGAKVVLPNWIVVTISDATYKQVLKYSAVHKELDQIVGKTRFRITTAAVDQVIALGGIGTFTKAQLLSVLVDRADG